jgi:hypothetical protein
LTFLPLERSLSNVTVAAIIFCLIICNFYEQNLIFWTLQGKNKQ